jgi:NAD(P) transhydrogenase
VTLVEPRPSLLSFLDREIADALKAAMEKLGIVFRFGVKWREVKHDQSPIVAILADGSEIPCEKLLFAAGRMGNTRGLGLGALGLEADPRGTLTVDEHYRTKVPHVYAAGDVIGFPALASVSMEQARVAICHAFGFQYKSRVSSLLPYGIYTIPEVSCIGESEETCKEKHIDYVVGRARLSENARGQIAGDLDGLTKIIVERGTRKVVGVHLIGIAASELVHLGGAIVQLGGTVDAFIDMVFNYPTLSESYKYAAYNALSKL